MRILTRYLIRSHIGPFMFALTVLTSLIFLNAVAQRVEDLAGKGLHWTVIGEFLLLSLPHVIALSLPMSILVAVLYTFSDLTAGNELTAMSAGGVPPRRIVLPMLGAGILMAGVMFYFNDSILPETNHRLKNLSVDIGQKSPTFELREQLVNEIASTDGSTRVFLKASSIDPVTNEMQDVTIHDLSEHDRLRTIYANHGTMAFNAERTDLYLTLYDGEVREVAENRRGSFNRLFFAEQIVPLRGISNALERRNDITRRSDREMSIQMLQEAADEELVDMEQVRQESLARARYAIRRSLGLSGRDDPFDDYDYQDLTGNPASTRPERRGVQFQGDSARTGSSVSLASPRSAGLVVSFAGQVQEDEEEPRLDQHPPDGVTQTVAMSYRTNQTRIEVMELNRSRYKVEIHKKLSLSFACIVFVLLGAPLAIRFPRGGAGMVIAVSIGIFAVYWMGLIGGERLADRGIMSPFWAMWTPNFIFLAAGIWLTLRMGRQGTTTRGGGWDDLLYTMKKGLTPGFLRRREA
jgi:lipopolysaccharide export system permease protein